MSAPAPHIEDVYADLGWSASTRDSSHHLQTVATDELKIGRIHSREGIYESLPSESVLRCVLVLEGNIESDYGGSCFGLETGQFVLLDGEENVTGETRDDCFRFYWEIAVSRFDAASLGAVYGEPLKASAPFKESLLYMSNTLLRYGVRHLNGGADDYGAAIMHLLRGMVKSRRHSQDDSRDHHRSRLLSEAQSIIEERFHQNGFTVEKLASALPISEPSLRRLFRAFGTTPHAEIQKRRVQYAQELLELEKTRTAKAADDIAMTSGFSSRAQMWRNIRRLR